MAVELASGYVSLVPSTKGFGSALDKQIGPEVDKAARNAGTRAGDGFTSSFGSSLGKLAAAVGAAFAGIQIGGFVKDAIGAASDLNETVNKVAVVLGADAFSQVEAFANTAATALGQSKQAALDAAATFGVFGKSAGLTGTKLADFSTQMVTLSSDLASFSNTSPEDAIVGITAALRGEFEPIRQYGVLIDEATLQQRALRLGLISTTKQALTPQQRVLAVQAEILAQTSDAQGDFARTSGGLANQQRILSAELKNAKSTLGQAFLPATLQVVTFLTTKGVPAFERFAAVLADKLPGALQTVSSKLAGFGRDIGVAVDSFKAGFDGQNVDLSGLQGVIQHAGQIIHDLIVVFTVDVPNAVRDFTDGFKNSAKGVEDSGLEGKLADLGEKLGALVKLVDDHKDVFGPIIAAISGLAAAFLVAAKAAPFLTNLANGFTVFKTAISLAGTPIGILLIALTALGTAAFIAYKKFTPFKAAVDSVVQTFKKSGFAAAVDEAGTQFGRLWDIVKPTLIDFRDKAIAWLKDNGPAILSALGKAIAGGLGFLKDELLVPLGNWITDTGLPFLKDKFANEWAPAAVNWIQETALPALRDKLPAIIDSILNFLQDNEPTILDGFRRLADKMFDWVEETAIPKLKEKLPGILDALTQWATDNLPKWEQQLGELAVGAVGAIALAIIKHIPDLFITIPGELFLLGVAMIGGIVAGALSSDAAAKLGEIASSILGFVTGLPEQIAAAAVGMWHGIVDAFDAVWGFITSDKFTSFFTGLPGAIAGAAVGMWDGIYDAFKSALNFIIRAWNGLEFKLPSFEGLSIAGHTVIPGFEGPTLGTPDIPELAGGGVFNSPFTGMLKLAETPAARPEIVTPQKLLAATFRKELATVGAGGGGGLHFGDIVVNGAQASPQSIADAVFAKAGWLHFTGRREL